MNINSNFGVILSRPRDQLLTPSIYYAKQWSAYSNAVCKLIRYQETIITDNDVDNHVTST